MQYKNLGRSGLKVSQLSFGAWVTFGNQIDVKEAKTLLQCCRDNGVNFFDNAEVYANGRAEEIMGQAIRELGWKRSDIVVSTKIFGEVLDLTIRITEACEIAKRLDLVGPIVEQPEYNMLSRHKVENEYLPLYNNYGIGLTTWSPLASGVLTGKYNSGVPADSRFALENYKNLASRSLVDDVLKKVRNLKPIADELDIPMSQLAIAWCAANPNVSSVITGATKEHQIQENMKAIDVIPKLTPDVMEKIEAAIQSKPKPPESFR
ncbi:hypothetical protein R6Q57_010881 [Mikania cordata]